MRESRIGALARPTCAPIGSLECKDTAAHMPVLHPNALVANRITAIRTFHAQCRLARAEIDISGGIDSAVMVHLLACALGPEHVFGVYSSIHSSQTSLRHARLAATSAGVQLIELNLDDIYDDLVNEVHRGLTAAGFALAPWLEAAATDGSVQGSLRSTLRAPVGRYINRFVGGGIRHGTGNEDEDRWLRFFQKGGDGEVDTNPIAMLSKGEVYQLAVALGVPPDIIHATPTPDLWGIAEAHSDEAELFSISGVEWTYSRVDPQRGVYTKVGTIERLSRLLDAQPGFESAIFGEGAFPPAICQQAEHMGLSEAHLVSARRWERVTRHKHNPNCPSLGTRAELLNAGLLTNNLPVVDAS